MLRLVSSNINNCSPMWKARCFDFPGCFVSLASWKQGVSKKILNLKNHICTVNNISMCDTWVSRVSSRILCPFCFSPAPLLLLNYNSLLSFHCNLCKGRISDIFRIIQKYITLQSLLTSDQTNKLTWRLYFLASLACYWPSQHSLCLATSDWPRRLHLTGGLSLVEVKRLSCDWLTVTWSLNCVKEAGG